MNPFAYSTGLIWGLVLLGSLVGWGWLARRALRLPRGAGSEPGAMEWPTDAAYGLAAVLALGGPLVWASAATRPVLAGLVLVGFLVWLVAVAPGWRLAVVRWRAAGWPGWLLAVLLALCFAGGVALPGRFEVNDDVAIYFPMVRRLLDTGGMIEEYSFRRIVTFGGGTLLQGLVFSVGSEKHMHVLDMSISRLIVAGLILSMRAGWRMRVAVAAGFLLLWVPQLNTSPLLAGVALLMVLGAELGRMVEVRPVRWERVAAAVGLLIAAAATLRVFFLMAAVAMVAAAACVVLVSRPAAWGRLLVAFAGAGLVAGAILVPWALVLWQSCGTPLFPLFPGHVNPAFLEVRAVTGAMERVGYLGYFFTRSATLGMVLGCFVAVALGTRMERMTGIALLTSGVIVADRVAGTVYSEVCRYVMPLLLAVWFTGMIAGARRIESLPVASRRRAGVIWGIVLLATVVLNQPMGGMQVAWLVGTLPRQVMNSAPFYPEGSARAYRELQSAIPEGVAVLAVVDHPACLDFRRNRVINPDILGAVSPPPGMPCREGPEALRAYLRGQGIRYILAVDFNRALRLYRRDFWVGHPRPEPYFEQIWGVHARDFMDAVDALAASGAPVRVSGTVRLIDLGE